MAPKNKAFLGKKNAHEKHARKPLREQNSQMAGAKNTRGHKIQIVHPRLPIGGIFPTNFPGGHREGKRHLQASSRNVPVVPVAAMEAILPHVLLPIHLRTFMPPGCPTSPTQVGSQSFSATPAMHQIQTCPLWSRGGPGFNLKAYCRGWMPPPVVQPK